MNIELRFFASLRERLKSSGGAREIPDGTTVGELWSTLCREHPEIELMSASMSFAVNREYVERDHRLRDGDELALIPPVSGGCG
jgi:molybdopterin synthase catalytic subunit